MKSATEKNIALAVKRTIMAADRSLMAWIRTSIALIGFGFTIYSFLASLITKDSLPILTEHGPRRIGLFLIGFGTLALILGSIQYWKMLREISKEFTCSPWRSTLILASLIIAVGFILFLAILVKIKII